MDLLEVIVAKHNNRYYDDTTMLPDEKVFHAVITDQDFVRQAREAISNLEIHPGGYGNIHGYPNYFHWLRFTTNDMTMLIYSGYSNDPVWNLNDTVSTKGVAAPAISGPVPDVMQTLRSRYGMPVPQGHDHPGAPYWLPEWRDLPRCPCEHCVRLRQLEGFPE